jgi:hypothetical protein
MSTAPGKSDQTKGAELLKFERQKLAVEVLLKRQELAANGSKGWKDIIGNPLVLAIVGGFVTIMTTIVANHSTTNATLETERVKAQLAEHADIRKGKIAEKAADRTLQADLIKKFSESAKTQTVRENLRFLADAGLIDDYKDKIREYLKNNPNSAPTSSITGADPDRFADLTYFVSGMSITTDGICSKPCPNDPMHQDTTSLRDPDTAKSLDPTQISYVVLPLRKSKTDQIALGDLAAVYNAQNKKLAFAVVGDLGPPSRLGEGSIALAQALDIPISPLSGVKGGISYVVFPNTKLSQHLTNDLIQIEGRKLFEAWGGEAELLRRLK